MTVSLWMFLWAQIIRTGPVNGCNLGWIETYLNAYTLDQLRPMNWEWFAWRKLLFYSLQLCESCCISEKYDWINSKMLSGWSFELMSEKFEIETEDESTQTRVLSNRLPGTERCRISDVEIMLQVSFTRNKTFSVCWFSFIQCFSTWYWSLHLS